MQQGKRRPARLRERGTGMAVEMKLEGLGTGLCTLWRAGCLTDIVLQSADGVEMGAHRIVLVSSHRAHGHAHGMQHLGLGLLLHNKTLGQELRVAQLRGWQGGGERGGAVYGGTCHTLS